MLNDGVRAVPSMSSSVAFLQYLVKLRKGMSKSFAVFLIDLPCFRTAFTACRITSGRVLPLSVLLL